MSTIDKILGETTRGWTAYMASDPRLAYDYAERTHAPFPEGEAAIATNPECSYNYAYYVLKGPFPAGEAAIATQAEIAVNYARGVLKGPFPLAEPVIADSPWYSLKYAHHALKARFPAGEKAIAQSRRSSLSSVYLELFPEAKDEWYALGWIPWF